MQNTDEAATARRLRAYLIIVGIAAFATTFPQQRMLGNLPTVFLLKEHFQLPKEKVAEFFLWATFAWNLKPIAGVLTDAFPLFGSRRRMYLLVGAVLAAGCWVGLGLFHDTYESILAFSIALNAAMVFASTAMGGLQVEASQAFSAPGRITSLRQIFTSIAQLSAPLLGGWLATQQFGLTAGIAATVLIGLAVATFIVLDEPRVPPAEPVSDELFARPRYKPSIGVFAGVLGLGGIAFYALTNPDFGNLGYSLVALLFVFLCILGLAMVPTRNPVIFRAQGQLTQILGSKTLWMAVVMLFLIYTVPGLNTALTYRQSDDLHFSKELIGTLTSWEAGMGLMAAFAYAAVCRRFTLRSMLLIAVGTNAAFTLGYLYYTEASAPFIQAATGFVGIASELALMDLAVRSTPKGCEALGFALMMSVRNFGVAMSDVIGTKMIDEFHFTFEQLVWINAGTTAAVLLFTPFLPKAVMSWREGQKA